MWVWGGGGVVVVTSFFPVMFVQHSLAGVRKAAVTTMGRLCQVWSGIAAEDRGEMGGVSLSDACGVTFACCAMLRCFFPLKTH